LSFVIWDLIDACDKYIPFFEHKQNLPFLMPIEKTEQ